MITRIETPGAWYGEHLPNGRYIIGFPNGWTRTEAGDVFYTPALIYPRINPAALGFAGVDPGTDHAVEYVPPGFASHGPACGNSPVAYWPDGRLEVTQCVPPYGSQGIRWIDSRIHPGDETISDPINGIYQYTEHNGIKVGQGGDGPYGEDPIVLIEGGVRYLLEPGACRVIRFNYDPITAALSISAWKMDVGSNVILALTVHDIPNLPKFPLNPEEPIVEIGKPCYLTWFEFNQPPPVDPPGNALIKIRYEESGAIVKLNGERFATWVDGFTVEEIEAKVQASPYPCVVYWDGREWPRWPVIRAYDWLCVYGYCFAGESPTQFEQILRTLIHNAQQRYNKVAVNCQCYTSNTLLTTNLKGLVPVYARVARDYPALDMLTVFSDQNRATGLNHHPELRPYWEELYDGITGEPGGPVADPEILPEDIYNKLVELRPKYPNPMGNRAAELLNETASHFPGWGLRLKIGGNVCPQPQTGTTCSCDRLTLPNSEYDCLTDSEGAATPVRGHREEGSPDRFVEPVPVNPPEPGQIDLRFQDYQTTVRRSDPKGFTIYWDMDSPRPVVYFELQLLGAPEIFKMEVLPPYPPDGRYFRGLAWKPTMNGTFVPRLLVKDDQDNSAQIDGVPVTVIP